MALATHTPYLTSAGRNFLIYHLEQGIGRGKEPITAALNEFAHGSGGNWHTTYSAVPAYLTSRNIGMVAFNTEPIIFDLCDATPNVAQLSVVNGGTQLSAQLLFARDPLDGIRMITETTGRQQPLPQWVSGQGAIVGYEGGTAAVRALHAKLKAANVSVAGYWLQDWSGLRQDTFGTRLWWNWR